MYNVAIIGVSGYGLVHFNNLRELTEAGTVHPAAACIINQSDEPEKCAWLRSRGCMLYTDYETLLREHAGKLDLVMIPTGIHHHAPMSLAAMHAGANVLVEKPAAALVRDVRAMQACEQETGCFVAVGYQSIYIPDTQSLKHRLCAGDFGRPRVLKCRGLWPRPDSYYTRNGWAGRLQARDQWVMDSPFNNALAHYLNLMLFLAGPTPRLSATPGRLVAELYRARDIESTDTSCMRIDTANGQTILFYVSHCPAATYGPEIVIRCDLATVTWFSQGITIAWNDGRVENHPACDNDTLRRSVPRAVIDRLRDPSVFVCDLEIAGRQTICANAAHDSSVIHTIPAACIDRHTAANGEVFSVVRDLDASIATAFEREVLFSDLGLPWACPGVPVELDGYPGYSAAL